MTQAIFSSFVRRKKAGAGNITYHITIPIEIVEAFEFLREAVEKKKKVRVIIEPLE